MLKRVWRWIIAPSTRFGWGPIFVAGGAAGIIFWGGFNTAMEYTNTMEFCVSCHEMEQLIFEEYKKSIHYSNRTWVRATCADCHVPRDWGAKVVRKVKASNELFHKLVGTIDTPQKFAARRLQLAERVWGDMLASGSRECRNCHSYAAMDFHSQKRRASKKMRTAKEKGKSCIECHKGIAHRLPQDYEADD